jgi:hypothetical protein
MIAFRQKGYSMISKMQLAGAVAGMVLLPLAAHASDADCAAISDAMDKSDVFSVHVTGYDFRPDQEDIHSGTKACARVRDDAADGQPATLYTRSYTAPKGSIHEQIWISKVNGKIRRQEIDGDIKGKGKGHLAMVA